ncbi:MAG: ankyrin repeat domain-containing protein, partial [Chloroflexi bacterium]|nr:ankyrin repeat domain-containing protein [Chloroflexota bacterium]
MYYTAISGRTDIAELLHAHGAAVNGGGGVSPPLHGAVYFNQPQMVEWLASHGAALNARDWQGCTALATAIASKRDEMANILRQHGAKSMASGFVNIAGCKLYYDEHGEGHP